MATFGDRLREKYEKAEVNHIASENLKNYEIIQRFEELIHRFVEIAKTQIENAVISGHYSTTAVFSIQEEYSSMLFNEIIRRIIKEGLKVLKSTCYIDGGDVYLYKIVISL